MIVTVCVSHLKPQTNLPLFPLRVCAVLDKFMTRKSRDCSSTCGEAFVCELKVRILFFESTPKTDIFHKNGYFG